MKGTPVCIGKIKARCCVAMTLEEAQNIQVLIFIHQIIAHLINLTLISHKERRHFDNL